MNFDPHQIIGIYGMGVEGKSLFSWLQKKKATKVFCFDDSNIGEPLTTKQKENFKELFSKQSIINKKNNDENIVSMEYGYKLPLSYLPLMEKIFRSPGVHPKKIIKYIGKENEKKISSSTQLFFDISPTKNIIGVTGTKGKGTTSSLIYEICKEYYKTEKQKNIFLGGNIGTPIFDFFDEIKKEDIVILEMSSFQLYNIKKSPHISVLLRTDKEHLDWHSDVDDYRNAKKNIFLHQKKDDIIIYFDNDTITHSLIDNEEILSEKISVFSQKEQSYIDVKNKKIISLFSSSEKNKTDEIDIFTTDIALRGDFHQENVLAALAVAQILEIPNRVSKKIISTFIGLPMRCEYIAEKNGRKFFNDSFSTIPETTISALSTFSSPLFLIVGGSEKKSNFTQLSEYIVNDENIKKIYLIGITAEKIKQSIKKACKKNNACEKIEKIEIKNDFQEIFSDFKQNSKKGDSLLMSPACASFGIFKNYKERGNVFNSCVKKF